MLRDAEYHNIDLLENTTADRMASCLYEGEPYSDDISEFAPCVCSVIAAVYGIF